ncbi:MAG: protein kinase [Planctomycetota bacterium]
MQCAECATPIPEGDDRCPACGKPAGAKTVESSHWTEQTTAGGAPAARAAGGALTAIGKYTIIRELGKGAMGRVYLALDRTLDRQVAIKTLIAGEDASEEAIARFMSEAQAAGKLRHPGIVSVHEVGQQRALYYMVMDYIEGTSLKALLQRGGLTAPRMAVLMRDTAAALDYAHRHGVVHRDVKPANILIDTEGGVHLMDFGLARNVSADHSITRAGDIVGSPAYLNPEQARGQSRNVDGRSDVYSLGAVFYEMLTGRPPAGGDDLMEVIRQVLEKDPPRPSRINPWVDRDLETICLKALFKEPDRRYPGAKAMADDLQRFLDNEPIQARRASLAYRIGKKVSKHRILVTAVGVVLLAAGLAVGYLLQVQGRTEAELAGKRRDEARHWMPIYIQTFDGLATLGPEWDTAMAGVLRENALYLDGAGGGTVVWLNIAITGEDWRFEYDGWPASEASQLNDIGLFVKADKAGREWQSGFEVQFGGRENRISGIILNGKDIYTVDRERTIKAGHQYHFTITYRGGVLSYVARDTTTKEVVFDREAQVPDIHIPRENQRQGFWTWGSRVYIDNVRLSRLGLPARRTYIDVASDFQEIVGVEAAVEYLTRELQVRTGFEERREAYFAIVRFTLNGSLRERDALASRVVGLYAVTFPGRVPSSILDDDLLRGFYELCFAAGRRGGLDPAVTVLLADDPAYQEQHTTLRNQDAGARLAALTGGIAAGDNREAIEGFTAIFAELRDTIPARAQEALTGIGRAYMAVHDPDQARTYLNRAVAEFPRETRGIIRALDALTEMERGLGNTAAAVQAQQRIMDLFPRDGAVCAEALIRIGREYRHGGALTEAVEALAQAAAREGAPRGIAALALYEAARIYIWQGDPVHAREAWTTLRDAHGGSAHYALIARFMLGEIGDAELRAGIGEGGEAALAHLQAERAWQEGDRTRALELMRQFITVAPQARADDARDALQILERSP